MAERPTDFNFQQPRLVERASGQIHVMQPTGRIKERTVLDKVEYSYEVQGQHLEEQGGVTGYPTKFIDRELLDINHQKELAETLSAIREPRNLGKQALGGVGLIEVPKEWVGSRPEVSVSQPPTDRRVPIEGVPASAYSARGFFNSREEHVRSLDPHNTNES